MPTASAKGEPGRAPFLSRAVAQGARLVDGFMSWSANLAIRLFLPSWRKLPSPFTPGIMHEVARGIRENSLMQNPLFNAYFFRAAIHIAGRYSQPPYLILEHRDRRGPAPAWRRRSTMAASENEVLARILIALVEQGPVARIGAIEGHNRFFGLVDPNIAVNAIACVALMFAEEGKPAQAIDEDSFFSVTGALVGPRLNTIATLVARRDTPGLAREFADIKTLY